MTIEKAFQDHYESLFDLKNQSTSFLTNNNKRSYVSLSINALELWRVQSRPVPSSKYGLEAICGASGEIAMN